MSYSTKMLSKSRLWLIGGIVVVGLAAGALATTGQAASRSLSLHGSYSTHEMPVGCTSPVGFCLVDMFRGTLNGPALGITQSISPTPDPLVFEADTNLVIHDIHGDLTCRAQSVFGTEPGNDSEFAFLCLVTSGTRLYAGATGYILSYGAKPPSATEVRTVYSGRIVLAK